MLPSERREFVRTHRTCVFGYARRDDGPALSVVYYVPTDAGEILVSAHARRAKTHAVASDPKVGLCVLDERGPFAYLQVYANAVVDRDRELAVDLTIAVAARMSGAPLPDEARAAVAVMAADEHRVVLRCRPYATFAQPPRAVSHDETGARPLVALPRRPSPGARPTHRVPSAVMVRSPMRSTRCEQPGTYWSAPIRSSLAGVVVGKRCGCCCRLAMVRSWPEPRR